MSLNEFYSIINNPIKKPDDISLKDIFIEHVVQRQGPFKDTKKQGQIIPLYEFPTKDINFLIKNRSLSTTKP